MPLQMDRAWPLVSGQLKGASAQPVEPVQLMVNTGAGNFDLVVNQSLADKLKLQPQALGVSRSNGEPISGLQQASVDSLELWGKTFHHLNAIIQPDMPGTPFQASLGMKFLKDHSAVIDCGKGTLDLQA